MPGVQSQIQEYRARFRSKSQIQENRARSRSTEPDPGTSPEVQSRIQEYRARFRIKSQIQEYLDWHDNTPGCQHLALRTDDELASVAELMALAASVPGEGGGSAGLTKGCG